MEEINDLLLKILDKVTINNLWNFLYLVAGALLGFLVQFLLNKRSEKQKRKDLLIETYSNLSEYGTRLIEVTKSIVVQIFLITYYQELLKTSIEKNENIDSINYLKNQFSEKNKFFKKLKDRRVEIISCFQRETTRFSLLSNSENGSQSLSNMKKYDVYKPVNEYLSNTEIEKIIDVNHGIVEITKSVNNEFGIMIQNYLTEVRPII